MPTYTSIDSDSDFRFKYFIQHKHVYLYSKTKKMITDMAYSIPYMSWRSDKC